MPTLSADQIYAYAIGAGFPPRTAMTMTAIALRESSGQTDAFNGKVVVCPDGAMACGDQSYGLWQINMLGAQGTPFGPCLGGQCGLGPARMASLGLSDPSELFDPGVNAAAAYAIWGGNDANLDIAWYIDRPGMNRDRYLAFLPQAQAAASRAGATVVNPDDILTTGGMIDQGKASQIILVSLVLGVLYAVVAD